MNGLRADFARLRERLHRFGEEREAVPPPCCIDLKVTTACMLRCAMCRSWAMPRRQLPLDTWRRAVDELASWSGAAKIVFSGGEPLMVDDLPDLIRHCSALGFSTVLPSNGWLLDAAMIDRLAEAGLSTLLLSLEARDPLHDRLRGREGVWQRVEAALQRLREVSPPYTVNLQTIILAQNLEHVCGLVQWVLEDPLLSSINFQAVAPTFGEPEERGWHQRSELWPRDLGQLDEILQRLAALRREGAPIVNEPYHFAFYQRYFRDPDQFTAHRCDLGRILLMVDDQGEVSSCFRLGSIGNVREAPLRDLWHGPRASELRRAIRSCAVSCNLPVNCNFEENARLACPDLLQGGA
ncbi:MAG: hypothetical protein A2284_08790 [Deltaproteobacteria bacterium RIFOXYA12_FULL_61_11]|nr:MAG: hypothetical protein A2284_08790 [Deltaproteobacteria bacterium RIFOXYA12_FULL_61_11]